MTGYASSMNIKNHPSKAAMKVNSGVLARITCLFIGSVIAPLPYIALAGDAVSAPAGDAGESSLDDQIEGVLDAIDLRERRAQSALERDERNAAKNAAVTRLGTDPTPAALAYGRKAAKDDPSNFSLRLALIDLVNHADLYNEADQMAATLVAEKPLGDRESLSQHKARQRALLKRVRMASDRADYAKARALLADLPKLKPSPELAKSALDVEARIADKQRRAALVAELEKLRSLPSDQALPLAQSSAAADPSKLEIRIFVADLLVEAGKFEQAEAELDRFIADPVTARDPGKRQSAQFKKARLAVKRNEFAEARRLVDGALTQPVVEPKQLERGVERAAELRQQIAEREQQYLLEQQVLAIGLEPTPKALAASAALYQQHPDSAAVAFHRARLLRNAMAFDDAEAIYNTLLAGPGSTDPELALRVQANLTDLHLRTAILAIGEVPTSTALAKAAALQAQYPESVDAAFFHAGLLRKARRFNEAETIYKTVLAGAGNTDTEVADRARLNLAQLYVGSNRIADASNLLQSFSSESSSPYVTGRIGDLGSRINQKLESDQVTGSFSVAAGYDTNAITRVDLLDQETGNVGLSKSSSPFQIIDLNAQYRHVIDDNGNFLAVNGSATHTVFNSDPGGGIDRTVFDLLAGPVYAVPAADMILSGGLSFRYRLRDYDFAREQPGVLLRIDKLVGNNFQMRSDLLYERTNDSFPGRDGNSYEARLQLRYLLSATGSVSALVRSRRDDTSIAYESRTTVAGNLSYRQEYPLADLPGTWFWAAGLTYTNLQFDAVNPRPDNLGRRREDNNLQVDANAGRDISENWTAGFRISYLGRDSTLPRNGADSVRFLFSLTCRY